MKEEGPRAIQMCFQQVAGLELATCTDTSDILVLQTQPKSDDRVWVSKRDLSAFKGSVSSLLRPGSANEYCLAGGPRNACCKSTAGHHKVIQGTLFLTMTR